MTNSLQRVESCSEVIVGRFYLVPTVEVEVRGVFRKWPVFGPWHADDEIIGFPQSHFHLDTRFIPAKSLSMIHDVHLGGRSHAAAYAVGSHGPRPAIVYRRRKCYRAMLEFPTDRAVWHWALRNKYAGAKLINYRCPHQGADLRSMQADGDGCVQCPMHGLKFQNGVCV